MADDGYRKVEEWDYNEDEVWQWFRDNFTVDLSQFGTEEEVREFINSLFDNPESKNLNKVRETGRELVTQRALEDWVPKEEKEEEAEVGEEERYHARELRRLRGERKGGQLEAISVVTVPEVEVPAEPAVPVVETPGAKMGRVVNEIESGVEESTRPLTVGQRVVDVGRRMRDTIADTLAGLADRIRGIGR